eukprot:m51a1_g9629 hypothetical protein (132) ;mRNA; r:1132464-1132859
MFPADPQRSHAPQGRAAHAPQQAPDASVTCAVGRANSCFCTASSIRCPRGPLSSHGLEGAGAALGNEPPRLARAQTLPDPVAAVVPLVLDSFDSALLSGPLVEAAGALCALGCQEEASRTELWASGLRLLQ